MSDRPMNTLPQEREVFSGKIENALYARHGRIQLSQLRANHLNWKRE